MITNEEAMGAGAIEPAAAELKQVVDYIDEMSRPVTKRTIHNEGWTKGKNDILKELIDDHARILHDRIDVLDQMPMREEDAELLYRIIDEFSQRADWRNRQEEEGRSNDLMDLKEALDARRRN